MALPPLRDLTSKYEVKGGSPRTPSGGVPVREYQEYVTTNESGGAFRVLAMLAGAAGAGWMMTILAWWTAFQGKGVTRDEVRNEIREYKDSVAQHSSLVDGEIGELRGKQETIIKDLNHVQYQQSTDEVNFTDFKTETRQSNKLVSDMLEAQKAKK